MIPAELLLICNRIFGHKLVGIVFRPVGQTALPVISVRQSARAVLEYMHMVRSVGVLALYHQSLYRLEGDLTGNGSVLTGLVIIDLLDGHYRGIDLCSVLIQRIDLVMDSDIRSQIDHSGVHVRTTYVRLVRILLRISIVRLQACRKPFGKLMRDVETACRTEESAPADDTFRIVERQRGKIRCMFALSRHRHITCGREGSPCHGIQPVSIDRIVLDIVPGLDICLRLVDVGVDISIIISVADQLG